jgi:hypothetical protein
MTHSALTFGVGAMSWEIPANLYDGVSDDLKKMLMAIDARYRSPSNGKHKRLSASKHSAALQLPTSNIIWKSMSPGHG